MIDETNHNYGVWPREWKARLRELRDGAGVSFKECAKIMSQEFAPRSFSRNSCICAAARMGLRFENPSPPMRYRDYLKAVT